MQLTIKSS